MLEDQREEGDNVCVQLEGKYITDEEDDGVREVIPEEMELVK